jgi:hypothetical protein
MKRFDALAFADAAKVFNTRSIVIRDKWFPWKAKPANDIYPSSKFTRLDALLLKGADFATAILPPPPPPQDELVPFPFYSHFIAHPQPPRAQTAIPAAAPPAAGTLPAKKPPVESLGAAFRLRLFREEMRAVTVPAALAPAPLPALSLPATEAFSAPAHQDQKPQNQETAAQKPRKTLTLKQKVELPAFTGITRASSADDFAHAFKTELKVVAEKKIGLGAGDIVGDLHAVFAEKRRNSLAQKSWKELMTEAQARPGKKDSDFDLGAAFRREMHALLGAEDQTDAPAAKRQKARGLAA